MKRNTIETGLAFVGLGMIYYGAGVKQCLHAAGQPAPNCHFTPLGDTFFLVGMVVAWIGIAPWKIYARNYLCQVCGAAFGGGKKVSSHKPRTSKVPTQTSTSGMSDGFVGLTSLPFSASSISLGRAS